MLNSLSINNGSFVQWIVIARWLLQLSSIHQTRNVSGVHRFSWCLSFLKKHFSAPCLTHWKLDPSLRRPDVKQCLALEKVHRMINSKSHSIKRAQQLNNNRTWHLKIASTQNARYVPNLYGKPIINDSYSINLDGTTDPTNASSSWMNNSQVGFTRTTIAMGMVKDNKKF